jgi:hypothetical protein
MEVNGPKTFALIVFATLSFLSFGYIGVYSFSELSYKEVFMTKDFLMMALLAVIILLWSLRFIITPYVKKESDFK